MPFPALLGTVVLAGLNPSAEPTFINGTYFAAGLDADGVPHVLAVDEDGNVNAELTSQKAQLSADVAMTNGNQYYDGPSLSLAPGTWILIASVHVIGGTGGSGDTIVRLWDGTTIYSSADQSNAGASFPLQISVCGLVTLTVTTTVKVSANNNPRAGGTLKAAPTNGSGDGNTASTLVALKVA